MTTEMTQDAKPPEASTTYPAGDWRQELLAKLAPPAEKRDEEPVKTETTRGYF